MSWVGASGGDWDTPGNWSNNAVPTGADDVSIAQNISITHNAAVADSVRSILMSSGDSLGLGAGSIAIVNVPPAQSASVLNGINVAGGTLFIDAPVTMQGLTNQFSDGKIDGNFSTLTNVGTLTISNSATTKRLYDTTLDNKGTIVHTAGQVNLSNETIQNESIYDFQNDATLHLGNDGGTNAFNNSGTVKKSAGAGNVIFDGSVPFNNAATGIITMTASGVGVAPTISLGGGGTSSGGTFNISANNTLDVTGNSFPVWTGTYTGSGAGVVELSNGQLRIGAANATLNFPQNLFQWNGGQLNIGGGGGATVTNAATGFINVTGTAGTNNRLYNGTLDNLGTVIQTADDTNGESLLFSNGIIQNDGTYDFRNTVTVHLGNEGGTNAFNNNNLLKKSAGAGNIIFDGSVPFNNAATGIISMTASGVGVAPTLSLAGGGTSSGGTFNISANNTLDVTGNNNPVWTGTYTGSGAGVVELSNGQLRIGAANAIFNFPQNLFQWNGGQLNIGGGGGTTVTNAATGFINVTGTAGTNDRLYNGTLDNLGTVIQTADSTNGESLLFSNGIIQNDGTYDFQNAVTVHLGNEGGTNAFNNNSLVKKSAGAGNVIFDGAVPFNNAAAGLINISAPGVTVTLAGGGTDLGGNFTIVPTSALDPTGGSFPVWTGTYTGSGGGAVLFSSGQIRIGLANATFNFPQNFFKWEGGELNIGGGGGATVTNAAGAFINVTGVPGASSRLYNGTLENLGTIIQTADDTNGELLLLQNATIQNDATYDFQNTVGTHIGNDGGTNAFNNNNLLKKSLGAGNVAFDGGVPFNNASTGVINISAPGATVTLAGGGTDLGGNFIIVPTSTLDPTGGSFPVWTGSYTGSGGGRVLFNTSQIRIGGANATFNFPQNFFQWQGGELNIDFTAGAGTTVTNAATGFMNVTGVPGASSRLYNGTLVNLGTIIQTADDTNGELLLLQNATIQNDGTYDFQNSVGTHIGNDGGTNAFNNNNLLKKSLGAGNVAFDGGVPFNNASTGVINISAPGATVTLAGGGTDAGGTFTIVPSSTLDLTGGSSPVLTGTYTGSGGGTVLLASGQLRAGPGDATFNFPQGMFQWNSGYFNINAGGGSTFTNAASGFITVAPNFGDNDRLYNGVLKNLGTIIQVAGDTNGETLRLQNATLENDGTYDFQNAADTHVANDGGTNLFVNNGTVKKSAGAGNVAIDPGVPFNNAAAGIINISALNVTLALAGGGNDSGGNFTVAATSFLDLTGGSTAFLAGTYTGSGAGNVELASGTLAAGATNPTLNFPQGLFIWTGGVISPTTGGKGGDTFFNTGFITLSGPNAKRLYNGTLDNQGTIIHSEGDIRIQNATLQNDGTYDFQDAGDTHVANDGGTNLVNNTATGIFKKSTGAGNAAIDSGVSYTSAGTTDVDAASLSINGAFNNLSSGTLTGGTWNVLNGSTLNTSGGAITTNAATAITLSGAGASWPSLNSLTENDSALNLLKGATLSTSSLHNPFPGSLTLGTGSTTGSGSKYTTTGLYNQDPIASDDGSLIVDIGGTPASGEFGSITANGVNVGTTGLLSGNLLNGFIPDSNYTYIIINNTATPIGSNPVVGQFNGLPQGGVVFLSGVPFKINYAGGDGNDVTLTAEIADLRITKTDGVTSAIPGTSTSYTITVTNLGPETVVNAPISDIFPSQIGSDSWNAVVAGGATVASSSGTGNIITTATIPANGTVTFTVLANIKSSAAGNLVNTATVAAPPTILDNNPGNNSATDNDTLTPQVDLVMNKSDGSGTAVPGTSTTYTITVNNTGPSDVTGATITDIISSNPKFIGDSWNLNATAGGASMTSPGTAGPFAGDMSAIVNIPAGGSITFNLTGQIASAATGSLANTASVAVPGGVTDTTPSNNSFTDTDTLTPQNDVGVTKSDGVTSVLQGGSTTYTVIVSNSGPSTATNISVTDALPTGISSFTWSGNGHTNVSGAVNDTIATLAPGGTVTYTIQANVSSTAAGTIANTANVSAANDTNSSNDAFTDTDTVIPTVATSFTVSAPSTTSAGTAFTITVTAKDSSNNTATGYRGTVHFTKTDAGAGSAVPADYTFTAADNGVHTFTNQSTLVTAGTRSITATDTAASSLTGTSNSITVVAANATHLLLSAPPSSTAGQAFSVTVTAEDQFNNVATGYRGTDHFTKSDGGSGSTVPSDYTFVAGDNGVHTFSNLTTFVTAGSQSVTATDTVANTITGTANVNVSAANATHLLVSTPSVVGAGSPFSVTVTAEDQFNNVATSYRGTDHFTKTDGGSGSAVPPDYTFLAGDNGVHTFTNGATLVTAGSQAITATDTSTSTITGSSGPIAVTAATATHLAVSAPSAVTAGQAFSITVTALDQFNNTATGYRGTDHFTKSDGGSGSAVPADYAFLASDNGVHTFTSQTTLVTAGVQSVTATDITTSTITGTANVNVSAANATHFQISAPSTATSGAPFSITLTALDQFNNVAIGYRGTDHFTKSDFGSGSSVPADYTFTAADNGVHTFANGVTLVTSGPQTVSTTDTVNPTITGTSGSINVTATTPATISAISAQWGTSGSAALFTQADGLRLLAAGRNTDLPWLGINKLAITLSQAATLSPSDVTVTGIKGGNYGPVTISGSGTSYTIIFAKPINAADRVTVTIGNAGITTYTRRIDVLPGDILEDGIVNAQDMAAVRNQLLTPASATIFGDIDGDGHVTVSDYTNLTRFVGSVLPALT